MGLGHLVENMREDLIRERAREYGQTADEYKSDKLN